jgi:hypothetical protein
MAHPLRCRGVFHMNSGVDMFAVPEWVMKSAREPDEELERRTAARPVALTS